jgi:RNA recognition motif-containing protein
MLKLSKDNTKLKRRIPYKKDTARQREEDKAIVYLESFPEELSHEELASVFKRAGRIKHVSMPKYKNGRQSKGFAFIEFSSENDAKEAVKLFDNTIPVEFIEAMSENFIPVQGVIKPFKVMTKIDWIKAKEEMRQIKQEIAVLNPECMFQPTKLPPAKSEDAEMKSSTQDKSFKSSENGSIVKI